MIKKIILLTIITLIMVGCDYNSNSNINTNTGGYIYETIIIDSCEYIRAAYRLTHKGNCYFCKERRQKELKKFIEQLKEK